MGISALCLRLALGALRTVRVPVLAIAAASDSKPYSDAKSRVIVGQFDRRTVQVGDSFYQSETQAAALCGSAFLQPIEAAENVFALRSRNARARIENTQYRRSRLLSKDDGYFDAA